MAKGSISVEIRADLLNTPDNERWKAIVTTARGRSYYAVYSGDRPAVEKVRQDWADDRGTSRAKNWSPYFS